MFRTPFVAALLAGGISLCCCLAGAVNLIAQDEPAAKSGEKSATPEPAAGENDFLKSEPYDANRSTLAGRWVLTYFDNQQGASEPLLVIDISGSEEGPLKASMTSSVGPFEGSKVKSISMKDGLLELEVDTPGSPLLFQGRREGPIVRGNMAAPSGAMFPADCTRPAPSLSAVQKSRRGAFTGDGRRWQTEGKNRIAKLQEVVAKYPESPLALDAAEEVLQVADVNNMEVADVEKSADNYIQLAERWGPRWRKTRIATVAALARAPRFAQVALKYAAAAEEYIADTVRDNGRTRLTLAKARALIGSGTESHRKQGAETLRQLHEKYKLDTDITADLLNFERQFGKLDKAIELAAQLVAYPPTGEEFQKWQAAAKQGVDYVGGLRAQLTELWTKKHNDTNGLEAYIDTVYLQSVDLLSDEKPEPKNAGGKQRVALFEMFTGAACVPCVAADLSLSKIERSFPASDVIVLRYHQHSPAPDPMTNSDGQQRAEYYATQGTPTAFANGSPVEHIGGLFDNAPMTYATLRKPIDSINDTPSEINVKLTASVKDGVIDFSATADGVKKIASERRLGNTSFMLFLAAGGGLLIAIALVLMGPRAKRFIVSRVDSPWMHALLLRRIRWLLAAGFLVGALAAGNQLRATDADIGDLRLRLALAENDIHFGAPNGIRIHDGIVRAMPGGADGVKPSGGQLAYSGTIDLYALRRQLGQEIADFEKKHNVEFHDRPLDLTKLTLVAFVQNNNSKEVLQSAALEVEGLPGSPKMPSPPPTQGASPEGNKQSEAGPQLNDPNSGTGGPSLTPQPELTIPPAPEQPNANPESPQESQPSAEPGK